MRHILKIVILKARIYSCISEIVLLKVVSILYRHFVHVGLADVGKIQSNKKGFKLFRHSLFDKDKFIKTFEK